MRARVECCSHHDRVGRVRCRADHLRSGARAVEVVDRHDAAPEFGCEFLHQVFGVVKVAATHADLVEGPYARDRVGVRSGLHAGAEDGEHARVMAREQVGRERGPGRGARRGHGRAVDQRSRCARRGVEHDDHRLVRRPPRPRVVGEEADELRGQPVRVRKISGHRDEKSVALVDLGRDARWHRRPALAHIDHRRRQRLSQLVGIEQ